MGKVKNIEQYGWNGQKAQKLLAQDCYGHKQYALKGQKLLAQGSALGYFVRKPSPCKVGCSKSV